MQDFIFEEEEQQLSFTTISSMVRVLNSELLKNPTLANDLLLFLKERNIEVPVSSHNDLNLRVPVSYGAKKPSEQIHKLKRAFEGVNTIEKIL